MNMDPNLIAHKAYLKDIENSYLGNSYDHSVPRLTGWRAERQIAEMSNQKPQLDTFAQRSPISTIVGRFRLLGVMTESGV